MMVVNTLFVMSSLMLQNYYEPLKCAIPKKDDF